jgi:hypothetical protein
MLNVGSPYECRIVGPEDFVPTNLVILGSNEYEDLTDSWFQVVLSPDLGAIPRSKYVGFLLPDWIPLGDAHDDLKLPFR